MLVKVFVNGQRWIKNNIELVTCDNVEQVQDYMLDAGYVDIDDVIEIEEHIPEIVECKILALNFKGFEFQEQTPTSEAFLRTFANLVATYGQDEFIKHARFHLKELKPKKVG